MIKNQPQNSPKQWKKDGETSVKDKLKGWKFYLLEESTLWGTKPSQNLLNELQEDLLEPQFKDNQPLCITTYKCRYTSPLPRHPSSKLHIHGLRSLGTGFWADRRSFEPRKRPFCCCATRVNTSHLLYLFCTLASLSFFHCFGLLFGVVLNYKKVWFSVLKMLV